MQKDESELVAFLKKSNLSMDDWTNSGFEWTDLQNIGRDYESKRPSLDGVSEFIAKTLQVCPQVHSVRWRVKDVDHLLAKLVRKRAQENEKYLDVSVENYVQKVTDLVGIRVLHLFKGEWERIDSFNSIKVVNA